VSLVKIQQIDGGGRLQASLFNNFTCLSIVQIQSLGPGTLRIDKSFQDLDQQPVDPVQGGLRIAPADGPREFWWIGELWIASDANETDAVIIVHPVGGLNAA
jgi:hypothetical protein